MQPVVVYLAGASSELARVTRWARVLERAPHISIAQRWFDDAWAGKDAFAARAEQRRIAEEEQEAIRRARIFWLLWPASRAAGAFVELGFALAHRYYVERPYDIIVSGEGASGSIFTATSDYRTDADMLGLDAVLTFAVRHMPSRESAR